MHFLVEVKADRDIEMRAVHTRRVAAEVWSRLVTDQGTMGQWRYVFVPCSAVGCSYWLWRRLSPFTTSRPPGLRRYLHTMPSVLTPH